MELQARAQRAHASHITHIMHHMHGNDEYSYSFNLQRSIDIRSCHVRCSCARAPNSRAAPGRFARARTHHLASRAQAGRRAHPAQGAAGTQRERVVAGFKNHSSSRSGQHRNARIIHASLMNHRVAHARTCNTSLVHRRGWG